VCRRIRELFERATCAASHAGHTSESGEEARIGPLVVHGWYDERANTHGSV
jgi:hypothetical protein